MAFRVTAPNASGATAGDASPDRSLRADGILHRYAGSDRPVLQEVDLRVLPGEFVVLVGPSGSGKTTLLRILAGLLTPTTGDITIAGLPVTDPSVASGFVFQEDRLLPWARIEDNVAYGLRLRGVARESRLARARGMLSLVGLSEAGRLYPHQLSGGMRQRANLARALAIDPTILLMDEPFAALDALSRERMQMELLRVWETTRNTVVFITHQIDEAVFLADRVVVLGGDGRIADEVTVGLARPRQLDIKYSADFRELVSRIWTCISNGENGSPSDEPPAHESRNAL